jgi:uncharacterized protein (TIGR02453 family)
MDKFSGFQADNFRFMTELQQNNNKQWFDGNRERWEALRETLRALCVELTPFIGDLDPELETEPKTGRCLAPINRDIRFSKDKSPYKPYVDIIFFPRDNRRTCAPGFAVGVGDGNSYIGTWRGEQQTAFRDRFTANVAAHPEIFNAYLKENGNFADMSIEGESFSKPRVEGLDEPAYGWAQRKFFYLGLLTPPEKVVTMGEKYVKLIEKSFIRLYPLFLFHTSVALPADLERFRNKFA